MNTYSRWFIAFVCCLLLCVSAFAQQPGVASPNLEQRLRERCEGLYSAIKESQWRKVESFFNEDAKVAWAAQKKSAIYGFEIQSVTVAADGKTGTTATAVDSPMRIPGFPATKIRIQQNVQWAWENGDWFALLKDLPDQAEIVKMGPGGVPEAPPAPPENTIPSELEFTSRTYDFKLIRRGETINAKWYFTNKSDHVVKAKADIFNPCGCLTARMSKTEFKPGEDGWVEVTWDTKDFGGYQRQGLEVNIQPSGAKVLLQMRGNILLPWQNRDQK